jgi:hypothetical protein
MAMSLLVLVTIFVAKMSPKELCMYFCFPRPEGRGNLKIIEVNKVEIIINYSTYLIFLDGG